MPPEVQADDLALARWRENAAALLRAGVLMTSHGLALAALAFAEADFLRLRAKLRELNYPVEHPLMVQSRLAGERMIRAQGEFGLTPVTAPRVVAQHDADHFQAFVAAKPAR
jgi:hypothetical protein